MRGNVELHQRLLGKSSSHLYMNCKLEKRKSGPTLDFQNKLKDGVILCNLLCKLDPKVHIKYSKTSKQAASCLDNIQVFLNICQDWKLNSTFTGDLDLYELQKISQK